MQEESAQRREEQGLVEDVIPNAFTTDLKQTAESAAETPPTVEWKCNCLLPAGVRNDQLDATYGCDRQLYGLPSYVITMTRNISLMGAT